METDPPAGGGAGGAAWESRWIIAAAQYDYDKGGLQLATSTEWVKSLGISYSVGFYGFSIWLTGVTVVVSAAAIGYALWVGRDRPRAYHALMLGLTGAVVATFASQDIDLRISRQAVRTGQGNLTGLRLFGWRDGLSIDTETRCVKIPTSPSASGTASRSRRSRASGSLRCLDSPS